MEKLLNWIDARFPLTALWESQWGKYVAPKNFNFWYYFGSLAALVLVLQILTGIFLTMSYKPDATKALWMAAWRGDSMFAGPGSQTPARWVVEASPSVTPFRKLPLGV